MEEFFHFFLQKRMIPIKIIKVVVILEMEMDILAVKKSYKGISKKTLEEKIKKLAAIDFKIIFYLN